jgi:hypothetical protein
MQDIARLVTLLLLATGCSPDSAVATRATDAGDASSDAGPVRWRTVFSELPGALFSVWGTGENDVWTVGSAASDGHGPLVLHYDGKSWSRMTAAPGGDLWWVHGFASGAVFLGGSNGMIVRFAGGRFVRVPTPKTIGTVFGIWGGDEGDVWAVGGDVLYGTGAFVWRYRGDRFESVGELPVPAREVSAYFKVWGTSRKDVWVVGSPGLSLHFDGTTFERVEPNVPDPLFTVHARAAGDLYAAVGGADLGVLIERAADGAWSTATVPSGTRVLFGVWLTPDGGYAVGDDATILSRGRVGWTTELTSLRFDKALHSVWVDPDGGVWAVGGDVLVPPYGAGGLLHKGAAIPTTYVVAPAPVDAAVDRDVIVSDGHADARPPSEAGGAAGDARSPGHDGAVVVDAAPPSHDASPEAAPPPRSVACGFTVCTLPLEKCCADEKTGMAVGCISADTPCAMGLAPVVCDEPSDCGSGFACCLNRLAQVGPLQNVDCEPSCFGPSVCGSDADCGNAPCTPFVVMPTYHTCPPPQP